MSLRCQPTSSDCDGSTNDTISDQTESTKERKDVSTYIYSVMDMLLDINEVEIITTPYYSDTLDEQEYH